MARVKQFDHEEVLDKALLLFWEKGYGATSVQDLVDRLGINRFSIYASFGDKHGLLIAALDRYATCYANQLLDILEGDEDGLSAIQDFFRTMALALAGPNGKLGCPVQNITLEMALHDETVAAKVREINGYQIAALKAALQRARDAGNLQPAQDLDDLANYFFTVGQGMVVTTKWSRGASAAEVTARFIIDEVESWRMTKEADE